MKRLLMFAVLAVASSFALAQTCDLTYTMDTNTMDDQDVAFASTTLSAVPMVDVLDNHEKQLKVLSVASKQDESVTKVHGPYKLELSEYRQCDGGAKTKIVDGGVMVQGVTLKGMNKIAREGLKQADLITARYEKRAAHGDKHGWDHSKAKKVKRNDVGQRVAD